MEALNIFDVSIIMKEYKLAATQGQEGAIPPPPFIFNIGFWAKNYMHGMRYI